MALLFSSALNFYLKYSKYSKHSNLQAFLSEVRVKSHLLVLSYTLNKSMKEELDYRGLVIKFLAGEITEGDMDALKKWLEEDPLNRRIFDEENELWQQSGIKAKIYDFNTDKAWTDLSAKLGIRKKK